MFTLGIFAGAFVALLIAVVVACQKSASVPLEADVVPESLRGLSPAEASRLENWTGLLEGAGFRRVGEFRSVPKGASPTGSRQHQQRRAWISPDRKTWAWASHSVALSGAGPNEVALASLTLFFLSRSTDGTFFTTYSYNRDDSLEQIPGHSYRRFPWLVDAVALQHAHLSHVEEMAVSSPLREFEDGEFASTLVDYYQQTIRSLIQRGYLAPRGDWAFATPKAALAGFFVSTSPFRTATGRPWMIASKLLTLAGVAFAGAWALVHDAPEPQSRLELSVLFVAASLAAMVTFPLTRLTSWVYVLLPSGVYLEVRGQGDWVPWLASALTVGWLGATLEKWRYRQLARAFDPRTTIPAENHQWAAAGTALVLAGLFGGVAVAAALRSAAIGADTKTWIMLASSLAGLPGCLILFSTLLFDFVPSIKHRPGYRLYRSAGVGLVSVLFGLIAGYWLRSKDRELTDQRRQTLQSALEAWRAEKGEYPASLEQLVPTYLPAVPRPRMGWTSSQFTYASFTKPPRFRLGVPGEGRTIDFTYPPPSGRGADTSP